MCIHIRILFIYINVCIIFIIIFFHFKTFERFARYFIVSRVFAQVVNSQLTFEFRFGVVFSQ